MDIVKDKNIVLGVTGSIAAYKIADLCSRLKKRGANVTVVMTKNATNFITPITFETLTGNKCLIDTFDRNFERKVEHVELAKAADVLLVAPATANIIAKAACGIADDFLSTTILACTCPKLFAPAMNTRMYNNPITKDNIKRLENFGMEVIKPATGYLACGDTGEGKMPEVEDLIWHIESALTKKDCKGLNFLVTAGPTRESLDPVRFISNNSTGKMGIAIADVAAKRGGNVRLICGKTDIKKPIGVKVYDILSAQDMFEAVKECSDECDIIIKAAAVADYRPTEVKDEKIKKKDDNLTLDLERTRDILGYLGENKKPGQFLCGFSMETENLLENSRKKLTKKNADMIVANNLKVKGAGFGTDTNVVTLITGQDMIELEKMTKADVADRIIDEILKRKK